MIFSLILTKICEKETNYTEKFALLNLLKAIDKLSALQTPDKKENFETFKKSDDNPPDKQSDREQKEKSYNPLLGVLERHDRLSREIRARNGKV
jgi:hypothetical protein